MDHLLFASDTATLILGLGCALSVGLLLLAHWLTRREMRRRELAEARQLELAAQLKTSLEEQLKERTAQLDLKTDALLAETSRRVEAETVLRQNAERFGRLAAIVESSHDAIISQSLDGVITSWNPAAEHFFGYSSVEAMAQPITFLTPPDQLEEKAALLDRICAGESVGHFETVRQCKDGSSIAVSVSVSPIRDSAGRIVGALTIARDLRQQKQLLAELERMRAELEQWVAERQRTEEALRRLAAIVESSDDAIIGTTLDGVITSWNPAATRLLGYRYDEIIGRPIALLTPPDRVEEERQIIARIERGQRVANFEAGRHGKDGRLIDMAITISPIEDASGRVVGASMIARDITDRKKAAERIFASLREKDALLREIHHRVKNNMQVVSSLLQLQSGYLHDPKLAEPFQDCQDRIRTMALIHEKLYRTEGLAQIDFKEYLESLTDMLLRAQNKGPVIRPQFNLQPLALSIDLAIPLGLIANELISNCLKHAFNGRQNGVVRVALIRHNQADWRLAIGDDGSGLPDDFLQSTSLGVRLVRILTGQINGRMEYKNENGAEFAIIFSATGANVK